MNNRRLFLNFFFAVNFDHFHVLRVIGKGSFGKVSNPDATASGRRLIATLHFCTSVHFLYKKIKTKMENDVSGVCAGVHRAEA